MRMYDIIIKKRNGLPLTQAEIRYFVSGFTQGTIPDYQASALLMAIYFQGMNSEETAWLTDAMAASGDLIDLSDIPGIKVDKHSTGGVGDKTTLIVAPMVAACGVPVAKMSGRGLGHTGGTIDKLESIPGFQTTLDKKDFFNIVRKIGLSIIGQSGNISPADKKLYALRDVTATVDNLSLIASSIMSKKIASGANAIVLDVKTGSGAFMKTLNEAIELAKAMVDIGEKVGRRTIALITDMDIPLGYAIGNSLEVIEAVETLQGRGPLDLQTVCIQLAANMLYLSGKGSLKECETMCQDVLRNGKAFEKLKAMTKAQNGVVSVLEDTTKFNSAFVIYEVKAQVSGFITSMDTERCGIASVILGAGRENKNDPIDYSAGIMLRKKTGQWVEKGDTLAELHTNKPQTITSAQDVLLSAIQISDQKQESQPLIYARVSHEGVEIL